MKLIIIEEEEENHLNTLNENETKEFRDIFQLKANLFKTDNKKQSSLFQKRQEAVRYAMNYHRLLKESITEHKKIILDRINKKLESF